MSFKFGGRGQGREPMEGVKIAVTLACVSALYPDLLPSPAPRGAGGIPGTMKLARRFRDGGNKFGVRHDHIASIVDGFFVGFSVGGNFG